MDRHLNNVRTKLNAPRLDVSARGHRKINVRATSGKCIFSAMPSLCKAIHVIPLQMAPFWRRPPIPPARPSLGEAAARPSHSPSSLERCTYPRVPGDPQCPPMSALWRNSFCGHCPSPPPKQHRRAPTQKRRMNPRKTKQNTSANTRNGDTRSFRRERLPARNELSVQHELVSAH